MSRGGLSHCRSTFDPRTSCLPSVPGFTGTWEPGTHLFNRRRNCSWWPTGGLPPYSVDSRVFLTQDSQTTVFVANAKDVGAWGKMPSRSSFSVPVGLTALTSLVQASTFSLGHFSVQSPLIKLLLCSVWIYSGFTQTKGLLQIDSMGQVHSMSPAISFVSCAVFLGISARFRNRGILSFG